MQVDTRNEETQRLIGRIAFQFFENDEKKLLEVETGMKYNAVKFNLREYAGLKQQFPYTGIHLFRASTHFYKFVLTFEHVINQLRGFLQVVRNLDEIGNEKVYEQLKHEMPHPSFIPWFLLEDKDFMALPPEDQIKMSIRSWPGASELYLFRFPMLADLIALTQGLYILDPELKLERWVNYGPHQNATAAGESKAGNYNEADLKREVKNLVGPVFGGVNFGYINRALDTLNQPGFINPNGGPLSEITPAAYLAIGRKRLGNSPDAEVLAKYLQRLAAAFKRSRALVELYKTVNEVLREFHRVLSRTYLKLSQRGDFFVDNLMSGPLFGENMKCPDGSTVRLIGYDGKPLTPDESIMVVDGKRFISSKVDPKQSGCMPRVELEE